MWKVESDRYKPLFLLKKSIKYSIIYAIALVFLHHSNLLLHFSVVLFIMAVC